MKVAVFSTKPYDKEYLELLNHAEHELIYFETSLHVLTTDLAKDFGAVCVFVNDRIDRQTILQLKQNGVKIIALRCAGFNNVDLLAAKENGIRVVRVPSYSPEAVAEHTIALILTLNRKTHKAYNKVRECDFSLSKLVGFNLHQKVVGVIGTGQIGVAFCKIMLGFGCRVVAFDVQESDDLKILGVTYLPLEELYTCSDIISLHCPLNSSTRHIINENAILKMKDGVMIINTSRGALIETPMIIKYLKSRKIGYLGIDVYEQEENIFFNDLSETIIQDDLILRLLSFPNVLITAHQAFLTKEALTQISQTTLRNISDIEAGLRTKNEVL